MFKLSKLPFEWIRTFCALALSLLIAVIIIMCVSDEPLNALKSFLLGPVSTMRRFGNVIEMSIPFIFTGLAVCVMFKAKQFNMIADGAFFIGGFIASVVAVNVAIPFGISPALAVLAGGVVGGIAGFIPGFLKAKWGTNEFVISLMLNYVLLYLGVYLLGITIRDPNAGNLASFVMEKASKLAIIFPSTRIHFGLIIAIVMIILVSLFLYRTKYGYSLRMVGLNENFAKYSGIGVFSAIIYSQAIGGFIAGVGGAVEILGMYERFKWSSLTGFGFDGIIVAIIAKENPVMVIFAALFLAYLRVGADIMGRMSDIPSEIVSIIQAVIILLIAANAFLAKWRHRMILKQSKVEA